MSGHSKWSTIKRKKGAADARRSKMFSRVSKEIQIAAREGGPDPDMNSRLRLAISNAKGVNMPKENIDRAINRASKEADALQEVTFEGYAPHGIALFIECLTDNNNRTVSSIRSVFNRRGGSLGTSGSVAFMFDRKGVITVPRGELDPEEFELEIIDAGVEDVELEGDLFVITTALEDFGNLAVAQAQPALAARLLGAAEALREAISAPLTPDSRVEYDQSVDAIRSQVDEMTFSQAWDEGREMTLEQAVEYALGETAQT